MKRNKTGRMGIEPYYPAIVPAKEKQEIVYGLK